MKIIVTGGAGFIGSHIVDKLVGFGHEVVVIDNLSTGKTENLNKDAKFFKLDIASNRIEKVFKEFKPDIVEHQAAQIDLRKSVADPVFDANTNIIGTINILQNCIKCGVKKVIFASSGGAIYGEQEKFPAPEYHQCNPISPYGIAKLVGEHYLRYYYFVHKLKYVSLRYANVYGPRQDPFGEAGVVGIFIQKMLNGSQPIINGDGSQTRDFVYVSDVIEANISAINSDICAEINIGSGIETNINDIFDKLADLTKYKLKKVYGAPKAGEQNRSVIDPSFAKKALKWKPVVGLDEGLKETVEFFKSGLINQTPTKLYNKK